MVEALDPRGIRSCTAVSFGKMGDMVDAELAGRYMRLVDGFVASPRKVSSTRTITAGSRWRRSVGVSRHCAALRSRAARCITTPQQGCSPLCAMAVLRSTRSAAGLGIIESVAG